MVALDPNVQFVEDALQTAFCDEVGAAPVVQLAALQLFHDAVPQSAPAVPHQYLLPGVVVLALKVARVPTHAMSAPLWVAPVLCGAVAVRFLTIICTLSPAVELTVCSNVKPLVRAELEKVSPPAEAASTATTY